MIKELALQSAVEGLNKRLAESDRERLSVMLYTWLATEAKKKPLADLPVRLEKMKDRIDNFSKTVELTFDEDLSFTINAEGDAETTLLYLMRGTDWFDGHPDLPSLLAEECLQ